MSKLASSPVTSRMCRTTGRVEAMAMAASGPALRRAETSTPRAVESMKSSCVRSITSRSRPAAAGPANALAQKRVELSDPAQHILLARAEPLLERLEQCLENRFDRRWLEPERAGDVSQLGGKVIRPDRYVQPDAQNRPALLRAPLDEDARHLASVDQDVVGPLQPGPPTRHRGHRDPRQKRQEARR